MLIFWNLVLVFFSYLAFQHKVKMTEEEFKALADKVAEAYQNI
jgi:hypothetical protein